MVIKSNPEGNKKAKFREKEDFSKQREIILRGDQKRKVKNRIAWKFAFALSLKLSQLLLINHARETLFLLLLAFPFRNSSIGIPSS